MGRLCLYIVDIKIFLRYNELDMSYYYVYLFTKEGFSKPYSCEIVVRGLFDIDFVRFLCFALR